MFLEYSPLLPKSPNLKYIEIETSEAFCADKTGKNEENPIAILKKTSHQYSLGCRPDLTERITLAPSHW